MVGTETKDEMALESIRALEEIIQEYILQGESVEEMSSMIMYQVLVFSLSGVTNNQNILHRKCWEYFENNKSKFMSTVP